VELARRLGDDELATEIEEDRETLVDVMRRLSVGRDELRQALAWGAEKALRLKPGGRLHDVEALSLGVEGKLLMWEALHDVLGGDPRLQDVDFEGLIGRARSQRDRLEQQRLRVADEELGGRG
jgi:hypothetical protein